MAERFIRGDTVFYIENMLKVTEAVVIRAEGGYCIVENKEGGKRIKLRESRFYRQKAEAEAVLLQHNKKMGVEYRSAKSDSDEPARPPMSPYEHWNYD